MDDSTDKTDSKGETATANQDSNDGVADNNQSPSKRSKREKSKDKSNPPSPKRQKSVDKKEVKDKDTSKPSADSTDDENQNIKTKTKKEEPLKNGSSTAAGIPMISDPRLPSGWARKVVQRQGGRSAGKFDVYIFSPEGKKFRSRFELARHFDKTSSSLKIEDFDFTVHGSGNKTVEKKPAKRKIEEKPKKTKSEPAPKKTKPSKAKKATASKQRLVVKLNFSPKKRALESLKQSSNASEASTSSKSASRRTSASSKSKKPPAKEKVKRDLLVGVGDDSRPSSADLVPEEVEQISTPDTTSTPEGTLECPSKSVGKIKLEEYETEDTREMTLNELERFVLLKQVSMLIMQEEKCKLRKEVLCLEKEKLTWENEKKKQQNVDDLSMTL